MWSCAICTLENEAFANLCDACGSARTVPPVVAPLSVAPPVVVNQSWACALCTFINDDPESLICGACESIRQRPRSSQPLLPIPAVPVFKLQSARSEPLHARAQSSSPVPPPAPFRSSSSSQFGGREQAAAMPAAHAAFEFDGDIDHFVDEDAQAVYSSSSSRFRSVVDPDSGSELDLTNPIGPASSQFNSAASLAAQSSSESEAADADDDDLANTNRMLQTNADQRKVTRVDKQAERDAAKARKLQEKADAKAAKAAAQEEKLMERQAAARRAGKFAAQEIKVLIDNAALVLPGKGEIVLKALEEKAYAYELADLPVSRSFQWQRLIADDENEDAYSVSENGQGSGPASKVIFKYTLIRLPADVFFEWHNSGQLIVCLNNILSVGDHEVTVLCEGVYEYINRHRDLQLRQAVQGADLPGGAAIRVGKRKTAAEIECPFESREQIDAFMLKLYFQHQGRCRFRMMKDLEASAEYIVRATRSLSESIYSGELSVVDTVKAVRPTGVPNAGHPMTVAWFNYLVLVPGVSEARAAAIVNQYPTLRSLHSALAACQSDQQRISLVAELRSADNGGRRLGDVLARRIVTCVHDSRNGDEQLM